MPFCHECGAAAAPGASFCGGCGIPLISIGDSGASRAIPGAAGRAMDMASATPAPDSSVAHSESVANSAYDDTEAPDLDITLVGHQMPDPEVPPAYLPLDDEINTLDPRMAAELLAGVVPEPPAPATEEPLPDEPEFQTVVRPLPAVDVATPIIEEKPPTLPVHANEDRGLVTDEDLISPSIEPEVSADDEMAVDTSPEHDDLAMVAAEDSFSESPEPVMGVVDRLENPPAPEPQPAASVPVLNLDATASSDRPRSSNQLKEGTVLNGRYEIVRRVGGGGMGAVYLAKDRHLGDAPRAVKEMIQAHLDESQQEKAVGDFKRESLLLTSLEHAAIPTIYDYFYDEGAARFYLVMKYISGGDFAARMRNAPGGRIDEKTVTQWAMEVTDVLEYLHNRRPQIIYRDLKPANLMIDGNSGRVMLIDFGIARWVNKEEKGVTAVGTMGYAPPELFSGKVEPRSDVYSLGATMFHMLTGADPQDNPLLIFDFGKHSRPRVINPSISVEMEHILMKAVEYKPEDRFHSAGEMGDVLSLHLERLRNGAVTYGPVAAPGVNAPAADSVFCGFCGGRIAAEDYFCAHCGAQQPLSGVAPSVPLAAGRVTAKLVLAGTTELEYPAFVLQKDSSLVGRSDPQSNNFPEIDLTRFDPQTKVSRRHARIWRKGEMFLIEDLGSVNGTVLFSRGNDTIRLAPHQPRVLENGDRLRLGETMLNFVVG